MWHVLALALGGRTIAEWKATMSMAEFRSWGEFYERWPFDDKHRYYRPAALVAGAFGGNSESAMRARLEWLQPSGRVPANDADAALYAAAGMRVVK